MWCILLFGQPLLHSRWRWASAVAVFEDCDAEWVRVEKLRLYEADAFGTRKIDGQP